MGDVGMRPSSGIGHRLHPARLIEALSGRPVGLDVDGLDDMAACNVGFKLLDRVIPTDRLVGAEDPRDLRARQPTEIAQSPYMMMPLDSGYGLHRMLQISDCVADGPSGAMRGRPERRKLGAVLAAPPFPARLVKNAKGLLCQRQRKPQGLPLRDHRAQVLTDRVTVEGRRSRVLGLQRLGDRSAAGSEHVRATRCLREQLDDPGGIETEMAEQRIGFSTTLT